MRTKTYITTTIEAIATGIVFLFITCYGGTGNFSGAIHGMIVLARDTLQGKGTYAQYYGVVPNTFWYSIRLILVALAMAVILSLIFTVAKVRLRRRAGRFVVETVTTVMESIPEPMYVILIVLLTLYLIENYTINIPVFIDGNPNFRDTLIPGIALALPAAVYLSRVLTLKILDELNSPYVITALSKGASHMRAFYRHVLANVLPTLLRHLPIAAAIVISSELFAELLLEYQGAFYRLPVYGLGWGQKPRGVAPYEAGYILVLGVLLIGIWWLIRLVSQAIFAAVFQQDTTTLPWPQRRQVKWQWLVFGLVLIGIVVLLSVFPHWVTPNNPKTEHLANMKTHLSAPFRPSAAFPLGTDFLGRDLLARTLQGTWATLSPAILCTLLVFAGSLFITAFAAARPGGWVAKGIRFVGSALTALPVYLSLLIALHPRSIHFSHPELHFLLWVVVLELGRSSYAFLKSYEEWYQFSFVQGATSIGRSRIGILYSHLRTWLTAFSLEFLFSELARILALMTMLAVFQIYAREGMVWNLAVSTTHKVIGSVQNTWFSMLGNTMLNGGYISYSFLLYAPVIALLLIMAGASFIARGLRGSAS